MKAIVIKTPGGPEVLTLEEVRTPTASRGEVRVRVGATAVNRADLLQRKGLYPAPPDAPQDIPGLEFAGEIDELGEGVTDWRVGDRVCGLVGGGAYAEQLVVHARTLVAMPANMTFSEAAALPEAFATALDAMVIQGGLAVGQSVLIHAVGSGVGTAAVQIARAMGARAIGTSRTERKLGEARRLGLDVGIVVGKDGTFAERVLAETNGRGVDVVLELVGGGYVAEDLRATKVGGHVVVVGLMAGRKVDLDLGLLLRRRIVMHGTVLRARPLEEKIATALALRNHLAPLFDSRTVRPVIDRTFPLAEAAAAHAYLESNEGFGKVVLEVATDGIGDRLAPS
ncbi:MAG: NAD(P)H-quinone oxidoreductase [Deltaproteobacteria bacterium]|nr:NAD(P)H-quinone oxidoreductase [Deltaproteobacteria bacterium]